MSTSDCANLPNSSGYIECIQGDTVTFTITVGGGVRSGSPLEAGLTADGTKPDDMYSISTSLSTIHNNRFIYKADVSLRSGNITITLNTGTVPTGNYRLYFVHVWSGNAFGVAYYYSDITVKAATTEEPQPPIQNDTPSVWANDLVQTAIDKLLVPVEFQNRFTGTATRADFCKIAFQAIGTSIKYKVYPASYYDLVEYVSRQGIDVTVTPFTDIDDFRITTLYKLGMINGVGEGKFDPNSQLTREQAATFIYNIAKALNLDVSGAGVSFSDKANISSWAVDAVNYVSRYEIMRGTGDGNFSPKGNYTYEQCYITLLNFHNVFVALDTVDTESLYPHPMIPNTQNPKDMGAPFTAIGVDFTIKYFSKGPGTPAEGKYSAYLFLSAPQTLDLDRQFIVGYMTLLRDEQGNIYRPSRAASIVNPGDSLAKFGGNYMYRYSVPDTVDVNTLTLLCNGEWRNLEAKPWLG